MKIWIKNNNSVKIIENILKNHFCSPIIGILNEIHRLEQFWTIRRATSHKLLLQKGMPGWIQFFRKSIVVVFMGKRCSKEWCNTKRFFFSIAWVTYSISVGALEQQHQCQKYIQTLISNYWTMLKIFLFKQSLKEVAVLKFWVIAITLHMLLVVSLWK